MTEKIRWVVLDTETEKYYSEFYGDIEWVDLEDAWLYDYNEEPDMYILKDTDKFKPVKVIETRELAEEEER